MRNRDLKAMSVEQLWELHERIVGELAAKMAAEKATLEERLSKLKSPPALMNQGRSRPRRPYPKVLPKYQNPKDPGETWAGRGKQPRWLKQQLRSGKKLESFLIKRTSAQ